MNYKNKIFVILLIICIIFSISSVVASDLDNATQEITNDDELDINQQASFTDLANKINNNENEIVLETDYKYDSSNDANYKDGISISRNYNSNKLVIDGKGHTIDGNGESKIFNVYQPNTTLKNIVFKNIYSSSTKTNGAIYWSGSDGALENCTFTDISVKYGTAAVNAHGANFLVKNCNFINNVAKKETILIIFGKDSKVIGCTFINNSGQYGGAVEFAYCADRSQLTYCTFINNSASSGNAVYWQGDEGVLNNCIFDNGEKYGSMVYWTGDEGSLTDCTFKGDSSNPISWRGADGYINNGIEDFRIAVYNNTIAYDNYDYYSMGSIKNYGSQEGNISIYLNDTLCYNQKIASNGYLYLNLDKILFGKSNIVIKFNNGNKSEILHDGLIDIDYYISFNDWDDEYNDEAIYYNNLNIVIHLPTSGTNGKLIATYNDVIKEVKYDSYGKAILTIPANEFTIGCHNITVRLVGDDVYFEKAFNHEIKVIPAIDVPDVISVGEIGSIVLDFPDNFKGKVSLYNGTLVDDDYDYYWLKNNLIGTADVLNGKAVISLEGFPLGRNIVVLNCTGDGDYEDYFIVNVIENNPNFNIGVESNIIEEGNDAVLKVSAPKSNEYVYGYVYIDGNFYDKYSLSKGNLNVKISDLDLGEHKIKVICRDYDEYEEDYDITYSNTFNVLVKQATKLIAQSVKVNYGFEGNLTATLQDINGNAISNANVLVNFNGVNRNLITDADGQINLPINGLSPNNYSATISFEGNDKYSNSSVTVNVIVNKIMTGLISSNVNCIYKDDKYLIATLKDNQGTPIIGEIVLVNLNGIKVAITDGNGQVKVSINSLVPKSYDVTLTFGGNDKYDKSTANVNVVVKKATPVITAAQKNFEPSVKTKKYSITLKNKQNKALKNTKVSIKVNGKTYSATTNNNGVATFKLTKLTKKGTYKAVITYAGNKNYNKATKSVTITVKPTPKITAKKATFKKSVKTKKYTVTLKVNSKVMKKTKVSIKVNKVTYKATTNNKGQATFKITKLTKKGTYKAAVTYAGNKNYNKATKNVNIIVK